MKRVLTCLGILFRVANLSNARGRGKRAGCSINLFETWFQRTVISSLQNFKNIVGRPTQCKLKIDMAGLQALPQMNSSLRAYRRALKAESAIGALSMRWFPSASAPFHKQFVSPRYF